MRQVISIRSVDSDTCTSLPQNSARHLPLAAMHTQQPFPLLHNDGLTVTCERSPTRARRGSGEHAARDQHPRCGKRHRAPVCAQLPRLRAVQQRRQQGVPCGQQFAENIKTCNVIIIVDQLID